MNRKTTTPVARGRRNEAYTHTHAHNFWASCPDMDGTGATREEEEEQQKLLRALLIRRF